MSMDHFDLKVGFYCCQDCVHCVSGSDRDYGSLSLSQIQDTIENIIPLKDSITLTGGEPTLRPDFLQILKLCRNHESIGLQTNGLGLTEDVVANLVQYRIHVLLTIHSCDKETYLKVSRGPEDGFDRAINAAKLLTKYNVSFTWQIVVNKFNKDSVIDTFRLARSINPNIQLKFTNPHPMGNASNKDILCTITELKPLIKDVCSEFRDKIWFEAVPFCCLQGYEDIMKRSSVIDQNDETLGLRFENNLNVRPYYMSRIRMKTRTCEKCELCIDDCPGVYTEYRDIFGQKTVEKELTPITRSTYKKNFMYDDFGLWIFTTSRCNCKCDYCKQTDTFLSENLNKDMTENNLRYVLDECVKAHEKGLVKKFDINLSGGEPFLAFDTFSKVIPEYRKKYQGLFSFSSSTNGTVINDEILEWIKNNLDSGLISIDYAGVSKRINGTQYVDNPIEVIKKLKMTNRVMAATVFDKQTTEEMLEMAKFAVANSRTWRILVATPVKKKKEEILEVMKPTLKYLYENNFYDRSKFDFDTWDLWNRCQISGCPCGRTFFSVLPNLEVSPTNGEDNITLGKFCWDLPKFVRHQKNTYYREKFLPEICKDCELAEICDGSCRANHADPVMLKERCDAIKELFEYVQTLKKDC